MYKVIQITALTPTHISVLLSDDVAYDVDRGAFEEWLTEGRGYVELTYQYINPSTNLPDEHSVATPLEEFWQDYLGASVHVEHINAYIAHSKSTQLDIDVVRAWENISKCLMAKDYEDIKAYGTAIKNQITYQNQ